MGSQSFSTAGLVKYNVVAGVGLITVKCWAGGGGGAGGGTSGSGGVGGGGGYVQGNISVTAGEELNVHVGGLGGLGTFVSTSGSAGGGAGDSFVTRKGTALLVAGGGGGGGAGDNSSATAGGAGGVGGGDTGGTGGSSGSAGGGGGGTQVAGGAAGTGGLYSGEVGSVSSIPAANFGNCLNFGGTDEYISTTNSYNNPQDFTTELWIKTTTTTGGYLASLENTLTGSSTSHDRRIWMRNDGKIQCGIYDSVLLYQTVTSASAYNDGEWHHIAMAHSSAGFELFIDGISQGTNVNPSTDSYVGWWRFGGVVTTTGWPDIPTSTHFIGKIDEIRWWSIRRTKCEIINNANRYVSSSASGLAFYYKLNESTGSSANDETTNNNDGVLRSMEDSDWVVSDWSAKFIGTGIGGEGANGTGGTGDQANGGITCGGAGGTADPSGTAGGGGAGAGYSGGGGGSCSANSDAGGGGGGGGSSYLAGSVTSTTNTQASGQTPPNTGDPYYTGSVGVGGNGGATSTSGSNGNDGLIIFLWQDPDPPLGLSFVGASSQYLVSESTFTPPVNSSVSFWFVLPQTNQLSYIISRSTTWYVGMEDDGGSPPNSIVNFLQSGTALYSNTSLQVNTLYHVVCTGSASARQIFINGVLDNSVASGGTPPVAGNIYIGSTGIPDSFFSGKLEDIRIYNRIISLAEVQTIYASRGIDGITYGLLHRWPLNELPVGGLYIGDLNFGITTLGTTGTTVGWTRMMGGDFPNVSGLKLVSVSIYVETTHTNQVRVAVYQGGTSTLPTGASLVEDLGQTTGSGTNQWLTLFSATNPTLTANTPTWVAVKGSSGFSVRYQTSSIGDWYSAHGRTDVGAMGTDPTVSYPSTVPSGGTNSAFWYSFYLTYGDGSGTGQMKDMGVDQINMTSQESPVYSGSQLIYRRKYRTH